MEQPNMMANGMSNMNAMQRPQPNNEQQQLFNKFHQHMSSRADELPPSWQKTHDLRQRAAVAMQIFTNLRLLNNADTSRCFDIAQNFEHSTLVSSNSVEEYRAKIMHKLQEITQKRNAQANQYANMQFNTNAMNNAMSNGGNGGNAGMMQNNMMNNNNMFQNQQMANSQQNEAFQNAGMNDFTNMPMAMPNMPYTAPNSSFPNQLQQQMQPTPVQPQGQPQAQNTMDPALLRNAQMQAQMPNMGQQNQQQAMMGNHTVQQQPPRPSQEEVRNTARKMYQSMTEERRNQMRESLMSNIDETQRRNWQAIQAQGHDPLERFLMNKAREMVIKNAREASIARAQQGGVGPRPPTGVNGNGAPQQQQTPQPGANIDFSGISGLQANAIKSQESGSEVVPASNNQSNFNLAGQTNMMQGINPQMLGNNNNKGAANNQNMSQQQLLAMQQRRNQEQMQRQNELAQRQALAQQANLRGQPGGLTAPNALNGGQVNSPAMNMSMLNRPMAPPGQATPATPQQQQNRPQGMPQTPVNAVNQLTQHHQQMLNQNMTQNGQPAMTEQQHFFQSLPADMRQKVSNLPPAALQNFFEMWKSGNLNLNLNGGQNMPNAQPNGTMNPQSMGGQSQGPRPPQPMAGGMPQDVGNAIPNFSSQPPANQQMGRPGMNPSLQQFYQARPELRARALDGFTYPRNILGQLAMQVPDAVRTWGNLKQRIRENPDYVPPTMLQKVAHLQNTWFEVHPEQVNEAMVVFHRNFHQWQLRQVQEAQARPQGQQQQQQPPMSAPQMGAVVQGGQAPPAQMVPPVAPMQQPSNQNANLGGPNMQMPQGGMKMPNIPPPTDYDVARFRENIPAARNASDEQIRNAIMGDRLKKIRQNMQNAQMQRARIAANGQQQNGMPSMNQLQPGAQPQINQPQNMQNQMQNQRRAQSNNDDVIEIKNPNAPPQPQMPHAQAKPPQGTQGQMKPLSQDEMAKLTPQDRARQAQQRDALRKAQTGLGANQQGQQQTPQTTTAQQSQAAPAAMQGMTPQQRQQQLLDMTKLRNMMAEVNQATPKGPPVEISEDDKRVASNILGQMTTYLANFDKTLYVAVASKQVEESKIRTAIRIKVKIGQNCADKNGTLKEPLSITLKEVQNMAMFLKSWVNEIGNIRKGWVPPGPQDSAQMQQASQSATKQQPAAQAPSLDRKPSQGRKQSAATKAPPAPTENKSFDQWPGSVSSPHGVPKYDPTHGQLTMDKLKFPPNKRRKTGQESQSSTPAAQTDTPAAASPGMPNKMPTPEKFRRPQPQQARQEVEKPKFRCDDSACEHSVSGFETEDALKQHEEAEHKPVDDAFGYLMSTIDDAEKVELDKEAAKKAQAHAQAKAGAQTAAKKPDAKPTVTAAGAEPTGKPDAAAADKSTVEAPAKPRKFIEVVAEKHNFELPPEEPEESPTAPAATATATETQRDALFTEEVPSIMLEGLEGFSTPTFEDWTNLPYRSEWETDETESSPDPQPTPSSSATHESTSSDIDEMARLKMIWQADPFGDGNTGIPQWMADREGLGGLTIESDSGKEKKDGEKEKEVDDMDWSDDFSFDDYFADNADAGTIN